MLETCAAAAAAAETPPPYMWLPIVVGGDGAKLESCERGKIPSSTDYPPDRLTPKAVWCFTAAKQ